MNTARSLLALGVLATPAFAAPKLHHPTQTDRPCIQLQVPVHVVANNSRFDMPRVDSTIDWVDWIWETERWSTPDAASRIRGVIPIDQTLTISAQLCVPPGGSKSQILQVATHGVGFDGRYWDVEVKAEQYSYVDAALSAGYSILSYDRLGTGGSDKPDGYDIVQAPVEVEIIKGLTAMARDGTLVSSSKVADGHASPALATYKAQKVVHVGHSYGSALTIGFVDAHPRLSDGIILTGWLFGNASGIIRFNAFGFEFAREQDPTLFVDRGSGYAVQGTKASAQQIFLKKGAFEPDLLDYAVSIKQTCTVGELISAFTVLGKPAFGFTGPVQFFVGEKDFPICAGDCNDIVDLQTTGYLFPNASTISVYLQPGTGHGLTLSTNATAGYGVMMDFFGRSGL